MADAARDLVGAVRRLVERGERDRNALVRVLALHRRDAPLSAGDGEPTCAHDGLPWPCPTARAAAPEERP